MGERSTLRVSVVGAGAWGTAICKIIANNVRPLKEFDSEVRLWAYPEVVDGVALGDGINARHENVKYLPGIDLPGNITASSDLGFVVSQADVLVIAVPHQFLHRVCEEMNGRVKPTAVGLSLIKGLDIQPGGRIELVSRVAEGLLGIRVSVLMGANIALEVAQEQFCESTLGARSEEHGQILHRLLQTPYFRVAIVTDCAGVEICGALKNIVACAAGIIDGLGLGSNTKAAVMRIGLLEMLRFADMFYEGVRTQTLLESCGVADLITTCSGGRNRRIAEAMVRTGKPLATMEEELLQGQVLGPLTARVVYQALKVARKQAEFPLFTAVHNFMCDTLKADEFLQTLTA
eukprot:EG_transcript_11451